MNLILKNLSHFLISTSILSRLRSIWHQEKILSMDVNIRHQKM